MKKAVENKTLINKIGDIIFDILYFVFKISADFYWRIYWYVRKGEYLKTHLVFEREGWHLKISIKKHSEFVEEIKQKIADYEGSRHETEFVRFALELAISGCAAIEIAQGKQLIQFWTGRGKLDCLVHFSNRKKDNKVYYCTLGLLAESGFVQDIYYPTRVPHLGSEVQFRRYKLEIDEYTRKIDAYFEKDVYAASNFVVNYFSEVFKDTKEDFRINFA